MKILNNYIKKRNEKRKIKNRRKMSSVEESQSFFEGLCIDIENIGFPNINTRNNSPLNAYDVWFRDVQANLERNEEGKINTNITGRYFIRPQAGLENQPCIKSEYIFKIKEGKLNIQYLPISQ